MTPNDNFQNLGGHSPQGGSAAQGGAALPGWTREVTLDEVRSIYVKNGYHRFQSLFARCDAAGGMVPSLVVAPFFISYFWFFYRKMYLEGFIFLGLNLLVFIGGSMFLGPEAEGINTLLGVLLVITIGMMVYGKALYWKAVDRKIAKSMRLYPDHPKEAMAWLNGIGGVNIWVLFIFIGLNLLMFMSFLGGISGQYQ